MILLSVYIIVGYQLQSKVKIIKICKIDIEYLARESGKVKDGNETLNDNGLLNLGERLIY